MRSAELERSLESLPARFSAPVSTRAGGRFRLRIGGSEHDVVIENASCRVESPNGIAPDVEISTDEATWLAMDRGELSGIEAFAARKLSVRGSIEGSLLFEPLFERPQRGGLRYSLRDVRVNGGSISALVAGRADAPPLVLLHGLGATKASWLTVVPGLARRYRVIAIDLPGFGASFKPLGPYSAAWFSGYVVRLLDALGYDSAFLAGNSMGGRIAMEVAMRAPERADAIACLAPVAAFTYRPALALARLARPELGVLAGRLPRKRVREGLRQLFADPGSIGDDWYDAAIDDFLKTWKSPRARIAFTRSLRNIYLDEPAGESGFYARLAQLEPPALYVYGRRDVLITHKFAQKIQRTVPQADVRVWRDCGHVPQIEFPDRTCAALTEFFSSKARAVAI